MFIGLYSRTTYLKSMEVTGNLSNNSVSYVLSHNQDTIHEEKGCVEMHDFHMAASIFLTDHGIKARTYVCVEITHFPTHCIIGTWKALSLWPHGFLL